MRSRQISGILCLCAALLFVVPLQAQQPAPNDPAPLNPSNLDLSTKPTQDFFQYANGGWMARNPVPAEYSRYGAFEELAERNLRDQHEILEEAAKNQAAKGSNVQRVGDLYASAMDSAAIEAAGLAPLAGDFQRITSLKNLAEIPAVVGYFHVHGISLMFNVYASPDTKNSTQVIAQLSQGGLGLPDRDYYTKDDERSKKIREEYILHLTKMFELLGDQSSVAATEAQTVMTIETELAKASMTLVERRDPVATYNKMTKSELAGLTPAFDWDRYFAAIDVPSPGPINVGQPEFFKGLSASLQQHPVNEWITYMRWHLINQTAGALSNAFVTENFRFYGNVLTGAKEIRPRWKRALSTVNGEIGEALGVLYVRKHFSPQAKERAKQLVENLRSAFRERIESRAWMGSDTKAKALTKLNAFNVKIGYPDKWRNYDGLVIDRGPYVLNVMRADSFEFRRVMAKIGQPVDRTEWFMTPATVNAYYEPSMNEIVFPAGILQPPFFDANADDAMNYGGIGAVIGHEMTHGFDDEGSQFDEKGNLHDWWTPSDKNAFMARGSLLVKQYSDFTPVDSLHLNGKLTLGENIADLGGLTIAYHALEKALQGKNIPPIDGFTQAQRFFLSWAQVWRANYRSEELRRRLIIDVHSPSRYRTNVPLMNMKEFYAAFNVNPGDPMRAERPVEIW